VSVRLLTVRVRHEHDIVGARQCAREIAAALFDAPNDAHATRYRSWPATRFMQAADSTIASKAPPHLGC
jgi:hypothetical protein